MNNVVSLVITALVSALASGCCTNYNDVLCVMCNNGVSFPQACEWKPTLDGCTGKRLFGHIDQLYKMLGATYVDNVKPEDRPTSQYATEVNMQNWVSGQGYATKGYVQGQKYATETYVQGQNYATEKYVTDQKYATETYVQGQRSAFETYVQGQNYATEKYVNDQRNATETFLTENFWTTADVALVWQVLAMDAQQRADAALTEAKKFVNQQQFMKKSDIQFNGFVKTVSTGGTTSDKREELMDESRGYCALSKVQFRIEAYGDVDDHHHCELFTQWYAGTSYYVLKAYAKDGSYGGYSTETICSATCFMF